MFGGESVLIYDSMEDGDNDNQPFFVLHKGSSISKPVFKPSRKRKTRRRIDLSQSNCKDEDKKVERMSMNLRYEAFKTVWSTIESTINDVLREINTSAFNEIYDWVCESFIEIKSLGSPSLCEATRPYPIVVNASSERIFTALVHTKNIEFVDDLLTFKELGQYLKSKGCHVANLCSLDFSSRTGIGGCLKSLLRQFLLVSLDLPDFSILATWYRENGNLNNPVVVIIEDLEKCCGSVLSDFIFILREWVLKVPVILLVGVATTFDSVRCRLCSNALQCLLPSKFELGTPLERMNAVSEAFFLKLQPGFAISHKVAIFMRNYFVHHDGTLTSFVKCLKIACARHFSEGPLCSISPWFHLGENCPGLLKECYGFSDEDMLVTDFEVQSMMDVIGRKTGLVEGLLDLKRSQNCWTSSVQCLFKALGPDKFLLLDLICEVLDIDSKKLKFCDDFRNVRGNSSAFSLDFDDKKNKTLIHQGIQRVRELSNLQLDKLLTDWEKLTKDNPQMCDKVKELQLLKICKFEGKKSQDSGHFPNKFEKKAASQYRKGLVNNEAETKNDKAAALLDYMIKNYMRPIEVEAFNEIICFKHVEKVKEALIGDTRRRIQQDLTEFQKILCCSCCSKSARTTSPSMPESSIMYSLSLEHGDVINLYNWYQSFKTTILATPSKRKSKGSPSPKKKKSTTSPQLSEASIQALFCRAVSDLHFIGLIRMPSKRRPDYVQRVAFTV